MKNKKAQTGKIIATLPVLILLVIIMGLFITLAMALSALNKPDELKATSLNLPENNLLLQQIEVELNDETTKTLLIHDAVALTLKGKLREDEMNSKIKSILKEENDCYLLFNTFQIEETDWIYGYKYHPIRFLEIYDYKPYKEKLSQTQITTNMNVERIFMHYFGKCP
ncbi:MAG: hypothetical protein ABIG28_00250 [archaeon]